ncbi:hypothetical protein Q426_08450 [Streptococcus equi subsp. zooepidemicus CY]|nr:hypothetical protein Q426_08450 [Streptococcus equi subsp. zooepidemicus CY]
MVGCQPPSIKQTRTILPILFSFFERIFVYTNQ